MVVDPKLFKGNNNNFTDTESNSFVFMYWDENGYDASMNSGLDDYPRNDYSNPQSHPIGHIDL